LWPLDIVQVPDERGFGYIMPLREPRFKSFSSLMKMRIDPTFNVLATLGINLANSFLQLHAKGFCYRDISFGNMFFDPDTGEVSICDNDNVAVDNGDRGGVLGTPRFMAPEIVRGDAWPSTQTDLFSLSVLLFYIFMIHHPLEGKRELNIKCLDLPAMKKLYGEKPVFIFDPEDSSNEPISGHHDNALDFWPLYPGQIKRLFVRSFTEGLLDPQRRVRESEWRNALVRLRDSIYHCSHCGNENFYDLDALQETGGRLPPCWSCRQVTELPLRLRIDRQIIMLLPGTQIFPFHVDEGGFSQPLAEVTRVEGIPDELGLKNLSKKKWTATSKSGQIRDIPSGSTLKLINGVRINFGRKEGHIRL
jgi:serine/threonine protein kinase